MTCEHNNRYVLNAIMASRDVDTVFLFASWQRYHDEAPAKMVAGIKALAKALKQSGKTVVLIHGMPRPDMPVPWTLARKSAANQDAPSSPRPFEPWLKATKAKTDIVTADLSEALCDDQKCALTKNGLVAPTDDVIRAALDGVPDSGYDPRPDLRSLTIPVLWQQGAADKRMYTPETLANLAAIGAGGTHEFTVKVYPGGAHSLRLTEHGTIAEERTSPGFAPGVFQDLTAWLRRSLPR